MINATTTDGIIYYSATDRGVDYTAYRDALGRWVVHSARRSLGRRNFGTVRHLDSLADVSAKVRAFRGLDMLAVAA